MQCCDFLIECDFNACEICTLSIYYNRIDVIILVYIIIFRIAQGSLYSPRSDILQT